MPGYILDSRLLRALLLARRGVVKHEACAMNEVCEKDFSAVQQAFDAVPESVVPYLVRLRDETDGLRKHVASLSKRLQTQVSEINTFVADKFS